MIKVACAIIVSEGKFLATQRGPGMKMPGKWEFPGGKVEQQETPRECIVREIAEELNIVIEPGEQLADCHYDYGDFQITLLPFLATIKSGTIKLLEHQGFKWLLPEELNDPDWAAADRVVVNELVMKINRR